MNKRAWLVCSSALAVAGAWVFGCSSGSTVRTTGFALPDGGSGRSDASTAQPDAADDEEPDDGCGKIVPGEYFAEYTQLPTSSAGCGSVENRTVTLTAEGYAPYVSGTECKTTRDVGSCSITHRCKGSTGRYVTDYEYVTDISGRGAIDPVEVSHTTRHEDTLQGTSSRCDWTITFTKK